jgi:hypothetical protein
MGKALELVSGFVTAPSTAFTAWTLASGNTLAVRNTDLAAKIALLEAWSDQQTAGNLRIRSPRLHDNVQGIRLFNVASEVAPLLQYDSPQMLIPQDLLTVEQTGSATAGDIESGSLLIYYDDLPGIEARLITEEELNTRALAIMATENTLALGTAGGYSGEETIVSEFDQWKANTDYALVGYQVSVECNCVRWRGSDSGNLGVGGPGNELRKDLTGNWFVYLSRRFNLPLIPVFNSANRFAVLIDGMQDENGADTTVTSIFIELK